MATAQQSSAIDKAFEVYWKADDAGSAAKAGERPIKAGVDFEYVSTLFKWAARDNDRTLLYAAEIKVQVP